MTKKEDMIMPVLKVYSEPALLMLYSKSEMFSVPDAPDIRLLCRYTGRTAFLACK